MEPHLQYRNKLIISGDNRWEANLSSSRRPYISICPVPRLPGLAGVNINANVNILINTGHGTMPSSSCYDHPLTTTRGDINLYLPKSSWKNTENQIILLQHKCGCLDNIILGFAEITCICILYRARHPRDNANTAGLIALTAMTDGGVGRHWSWSGGQWVNLVSRGRDDSIRLMIQLYLFINDEHHSETLATWRAAVSRYL